MVFFFKQKTAYEMRISDWSSDVCSSDLRLAAPLPFAVPVERLREQRAPAVELFARRLGYRSIPRLQRDRNHRLFGHAHLVGAGEPVGDSRQRQVGAGRSEERTSELQSLMRISYAVFCSKKQKTYAVFYLKNSRHTQHIR